MTGSSPGEGSSSCRSVQLSWGNPCCRSSGCSNFTLVQKSSKCMGKRLHGRLLNIKTSPLKAADLWRIENYIQEIPTFAILVLCLQCRALVAVRSRIVGCMNLKSKSSGLLLHKSRALSAILVSIWSSEEPAAWAYTPLNLREVFGMVL